MMKTLHGGWCLAGTMTWAKLGLLILSKLVRPALRTRCNESWDFHLHRSVLSWVHCWHVKKSRHEDGYLEHPESEQILEFISQ